MKKKTICSAYFTGVVTTRPVNKREEIIGHKSEQNYTCILNKKLNIK